MDILYNITVQRAMRKLLGVLGKDELEDDAKDAYDTVQKALENEGIKAFVPYTIKSLEKSMHEQIENIGECQRVEEVDYFLSEYQRMAESLQREVNSFADFMRRNYCRDFDENKED